jgi:hypothetical protein
MDDVLNQISQFIIKNLFTIFTILLIPLLISYIEKEYWSPLAKKKDIWKKFIIEDSFIKKCIKAYQNLDKKSDLSLSMIYFLTLLLTINLVAQLIIYIFLVIIVESKIIPLLRTYSIIDAQPTNHIYILSLILITIFTIPLLIYSSWMKKTQESIEKNNYEKTYSDIKTLHYICFLLSLFYIPLIISFVSTKQAESYFFLTLLVIPLFMFSNVISYKKSATMEVKNIINEMYSPRFPYIRISTMGAEHYDGKLKNIFDNESVRLICHKNETIILWDAIATISELNEPDEPQTQLLDFNAD